MKKENVHGNILYLGNDAEFYTQLISYYSSHSAKINCKTGVYERGTIIKQSTQSPIDIVFIDFTDHKVELDSLLEEIVFLKKVSQLKSILFIALFKDEQQKDELNFVFTSGFQFCYLKGAEVDTLFRDSFYVGLRTKTEFPVLALARNIDKKLKVGICSTIAGMNGSEFIVDTDVIKAEDFLEMNLPMFPDLKIGKFEIKESSEGSNLFPMTSSFRLVFPFAGPWQDPDENSIQSDTVETWLDNYREEFDQTLKTRVRVYSQDISILSDLFHEISERVLLDFSGSVEEFGQDILNSRPDLIILNLSDDPNGMIQLNALEFLYTSPFHECGYKPIIVITNSLSTGAALQKVFNYNMIVATKNKLDSSLVTSLVTKFQNKNQYGSSAPCRFKLGSSYRQIDVFQDFLITSLTEHEITFYSEREIPMFSVLHFSLPLDFHATIVPPISKLEKKVDQYHYLAFIHGLSEEKLMILRKFVNQIIHSPLKAFSPDCIKAKLREDVKETKTLQFPQSIPSKKIISDSDSTEPVEFKKKIMPGRSKL